MRTLSVLLATFVSFSVFAQQQKLSDKFEYKVTYKLTYKLDSTAQEATSEYMHLFLGEEFSMYASRGKSMAGAIERKGNSVSTSRAALTKFHYVIIKKFKDNKMLYTLSFPGKGSDRFYYPLEKNLFNWEIKSETKEIEGYSVQKATTNFEGRDYIAWFAPKIPTSDGPYKFNGLPGLILEIADTENEYVFEFFALEKLSPKVAYTINFKNYIETTPEDLAALWYRYRRDPFTYANNPNVKISAENHKKLVEGFTEMLEKENNPIELNN